jgi:hypothetical protein
LKNSVPLHPEFVTDETPVWANCEGRYAWPAARPESFIELRSDADRLTAGFIEVSSGQPLMRDELAQLLAEIARAEVFQEALLAPVSRLQQLRELEALGLVRYCPYPEEFWIALPAAKDFLAGAPSSGRHASLGSGAR